MKILMSAYSCEPNKGSEPSVGWNVVREAAKNHEVWVLTRPDESREAIEAELARNPIPNLHFVYFTLPIGGGAWRLGQSGAMQIHYYLWQVQAYFVAKRLHREIGFDLIHHVTFGSFWCPSFLSLLPVPFVWGPVGGGESAPAPFWQDFSPRAKLYETLRSTACWVGGNDPFVRLTAQRSATALVVSSDTYARLSSLGATQVDKIPGQTGINEQELAELEKLIHKPTDTPVRFASIGRLLHWKGFHLGIRAFAEAKIDNSEYWVIGNGPERDRLENLAKELGIAEKVQFFGAIPRTETLKAIGQCHVLVHPSLHDFSPTVCLEAMAAGCPVICLNLGGPSVQITDDAGFRIAAEHPDQAVSDLAKAMIRLAGDPELRVSMGQAGNKLVHKYHTWQAKGELLGQIYQEAISK